MDWTVIDEQGRKIVEGAPGQRFMARVQDVDGLLEACFSEGAEAALLYAENLTGAFFDLSSGEAGAILQKLRQYGVRLAVVRGAGAPEQSSRFGEMMAEERRGSFFGLFEARGAAVAWLSGA